MVVEFILSNRFCKFILPFKSKVLQVQQNLLSMLANTSSGINLTTTNTSDANYNANINLRAGNASQIISRDGTNNGYFRVTPDSTIVGQGLAGGYLTTNKTFFIITQDSFILTNVEQVPYSAPVMVIGPDGTLYKDTAFTSGGGNGIYGGSGEVPFGTEAFKKYFFIHSRRYGRW